MTKYARDEFDRVPETSARQGVHRAVAESRRRSLAPVLAVGCLALVVGLVAFLILPKLGFSSAGENAALAPDTAGTSAPASPGATSPAASDATPSEAPSASSTPSATPSATAAAADKTQPVAIYNGTTTAGLASRVGATVASAGWVLGPMGNWSGVPQQSSVIFYSSAAQKGNAEALGTLLGIPTLVESAEFKMPLVVVLGPGFQ
ncbi:LytR C-terminal domain-containing protein [Pseudarthrobacter sp. S9]|uniref:LytR C-terminal domain-containing protein n=1 Tax=Pseudarthrobacter sp. S9 TaxID=3418421 RepID=UPI003D0900CE